MKKILFILLLMFSFSFVNASSSVIKEKIENTLEIEYLSNLLLYKDKYFVVNYDNSFYKIALYDQNGEVIISKNSTDFGFKSWEGFYFCSTDNEYIYCIVSYEHLIKLDENLDAVNIVDVWGVDSGYAPIISAAEGNNAYYFREDSYSLILYDWIIKVNKDINSYEFDEYSVDNVKYNLPNYYDLLYNGYFGEVAGDVLQFSPDINIYSFDHSLDNKKILVSSYFDFCNIPGDHKELDNCGDERPILTLIDNIDKKVLWNKYFDEYSYVSNVEIYGDYLIFVGYFEDKTSELVVLDNFGEELDKIKLEGHLLYVNSNDSEIAGILETEDELKLVSYYFPTLVNINILSGKGILEIIGGEKTGDLVTINVEPKEGYEVEELIVTDKDGNKIEVKNNQFILPYGSVNVDVKFYVINPNTFTDIVLIFKCFLIFLLSFVFIKRACKKIQFLLN